MREPLALFLVYIPGCTNTEDAAATVVDEVTPTLSGVYEYLLEGSSGLFFYDDGYFVHFWIPDGVEPGEEGLTDEQRIELFRGMMLNAGTYSLSGDTCTNQVLYSKNPGEVGTAFRWVAEFSGDTLGWNVLNDEGEVTTRGRSIRVR